jgi:hypothetical protein
MYTRFNLDSQRIPTNTEYIWKTLDIYMCEQNHGLNRKKVFIAISNNSPNINRALNEIFFFFFKKSGKKEKSRRYI